MCCRRVPTGQAPKRAQFCCLSQPLELDRPTGTSCGHWTLLREPCPADAQHWHPPQSCGQSSAALTLLSTLTPSRVMVSPLQPVQPGVVLRINPSPHASLKPEPALQGAQGWGQQLPEDLSRCFSFSSAPSLWVQAMQLCLTSTSHRLHVSGIFQG